MGNTASASDRALAAVSKGDVRALQKVIANFPAGSHELRLVLDTRDADGRSCLTVAAIKNHVAVARMLLLCGADVHYINKTPSKCSTALHEAAARRHDDMVDLLLQYGANPFLANSNGETPMELAVLAGSSRSVKTFERRALFLGQVEMQWTKLMGMSNDYKLRRIVIMDHFPCPKPGAPLPPTRRQLWIYGDPKDGIMPKCRVWLDSACAIRTAAGNEFMLRLAHTHVQPCGNVYTRFSQGYCLFFRSTKPAAVMQNEPWENLLRLCNWTDTITIPSLASALKGPTGSALPLGLLPPNTPAGALPPARPQLATASAPPPSPGGAPAPGYSYPSMGGAATSQSYLQQLAYQSQSTSSLDSAQWQAPPAAGAASMPPHYTPAGAAVMGAQDRRPTTGAAAHGHNGQDSGYGSGGGGRGSGSGGLDLTQALPGESDAMFAARLAAEMSGGVSSAVDMQSRKLAAASSQPSANAGRYPTVAPAGASVALGYRPSAHTGASSSNTSPFSNIAAASAPFISLAPVIPAPEKPAAPSAPPPAPDHLAEDDSCVICLSAPREAGFLHGGTVHRCVCTACSKVVQADMAKRKQMPCPLCRQPVEQVIAIF